MNTNIVHSPLDRPDSSAPLSKLNNQSACILQCLMQHAQRNIHQSAMVAFLKLTVTSWDCIRYLRMHGDAAASLQSFIPQLYRLPEEIVHLLDGIRSDPDWESIQPEVIQALEADKSSLNSRPSSVRAPSFSQRSSTLSVSTVPSLFDESARNSMASFTSVDSLPLSRLDTRILPRDQRERTSAHTPSSANSPAVSTPPAVPPKDDKEHLCLSRNCGRRYKRYGDLVNHVDKHHPESQQAMNMKIALPQVHAASPAPSNRRLFGEITPSHPHGAAQEPMINSTTPGEAVMEEEVQFVLDEINYDAMDTTDFMALSQFANNGVAVYDYSTRMMPAAATVYQDSPMSGTTTSTAKVVSRSPSYRLFPTASSSTAKGGSQRLDGNPRGY